MTREQDLKLTELAALTEDLGLYDTPKTPTPPSFSMPKYIIKLNTQEGPRYLEYSTIVDAPTTNTMTREEFTAYYLDRYGTLEGFEERLIRVDTKGTSCESDLNLEETIFGNRAGEDQTSLTFDQFVAWYGRPDAYTNRAKRPRGTPFK